MKFMNKKNYGFFDFFFILITILILIYVFFKSEIIFDGLKRSYYFKYYIFSFLLFSFSIFFITLSKKLKNIFIFIFKFSLVIVFTAELFFTLKFWNNYHYITYEKYIKEYEKINNKTYDRRLINDIYFDEKKINPNLAISIGSTLYKKDSKIDLFPLGGVSNAVTIGCNLNGYWSLYKSDRYGFNNPDLVWETNGPDVFLFGNHEVHSNCLNRPFDIASLLRAKNLNDLNFINLGINSNGPITNYATLKEYSRKKVPKHIFWFFDEDTELDWIISDLKNIFLKNYFYNTNFNQDLINKQKNIDELIKNKIKLKLKIENEKEKKAKSINKEKIIKFLKLTFVRTYSIEKFFTLSKNNTVKNEMVPKEFKELTALLIDFSSKNNIKPHFVFMPTYKRYFKKHNFKNDLSDEIIKIAKDKGFDVINLIIDFDDYEDPKKLFAIKYYNGYSKDGNILIANKISEYLKD